MKKLNLKSFNTTSVKFGGYAALVTFAVLAGLVIVNLLIQEIPAELDMTESKLFSLSEPTLEILENIENDITIYGLYKTGQEASNVVEVLEQYDNASKKIHIQYIDPDMNPAFFSKYTETEEEIRLGSLIVESGNHFKIMSNNDLYNISYSQDGQPNVTGFSAEKVISGAIAYVKSGVIPKIYELAGHGEYTITDFGLSDFIDKENYSSESLNLLKTLSVPEDASLVLMMYPKADLTKEEADILFTYLDGGGRGIFHIGFVGADLTNLKTLLNSFGVELEHGIVMEGDKGHYSQNPIMLAPDYSEHDILKPIVESGNNMIIPIGLSLKEYERVKRNIDIEPLLITSSNSWLRTDLNDSTESMISTDVKGPLNIAVAVSQRKIDVDEPDGFRIVIVGNGDYIGPLSQLGIIKPNIDFFINSLAWVNFSKESVSVQSKSMFRLPLNMKANEVYIYSAIIVIIIPLLILITGLVVWLRRRHL